MLVLTRKPKEKILIGPDVAISILEVQGRQVRIGVEAPRNVSILRAEIVGREAKPKLDASPRKILIVDDSPEDRATYRRFIDPKTDAINFAEASCGEEGLNLYRSAAPDCVLLDYRLPDLNGLEFLDELRKEKASSKVPVIMLTGQGAEAVAVQALKNGAHDYIVKKDLTRDLLRRSVYGILNLDLRN